MRCRIADFVFDIRAKYAYLPKFCRSYLVSEDVPADFTVSVSEETLAKERLLQPGFDDGYLESICVLRQICNLVACAGTVLLHAAVVVADGVAYAFSAPSGTGKSTHISLWLEMLGDRAYVLNGDKPFLRRKDGALWVYGSPWCGKEGWNVNRSAPLGGLCFLERAAENRIRKVQPSEGVLRIFPQLVKPTEKAGVEATLAMADAILREVPVYVLGCNISPEAAQIAYAAMHENE